MKRFVLCFLCLAMLIAILSCNSENYIDTENKENSENIPPKEESTALVGEYMSLTYRSMQDASFAFDQRGQYYAYVSEWDTYFQIPLNYEEYSVVDALLCEDTLWIMAFSFSSWTVLTMSLSRGGDIIDRYSYTYSVSVSDYGSSGGDDWLFNCYKEDCFYVFFLDAQSPSNDLYYAITTFKSSDCGRTWTKENDTQAGIHIFREYLDIFKFVTNDVGIKSHRYISTDLCSRSFLTVDGGDTWKNLNIELFYDQNDYSEVIDLEYTEGKYSLTIKTIEYYQEKDAKHTYNSCFISDDAVEWAYVGRLDEEFYINRTEVTQEEFQTYVKIN